MFKNYSTIRRDLFNDHYNIQKHHSEKHTLQRVSIIKNITFIWECSQIHAHKHAHNTCTQALTHTYTLNSDTFMEEADCTILFLYSGIESLVVSFLVVATQTYLTNTLELRPSSFNRSPRHVNDLSRLHACCGFLWSRQNEDKNKFKKIEGMPKIIDNLNSRLFVNYMGMFICYQFLISKFLFLLFL